MSTAPPTVVTGRAARSGTRAGVLVVGGTGILRPAVDVLLARGIAVTVLSRSEARVEALPPGVRGVVGDLDDPASLARALRSSRPAAGACLAYLPGAVPSPVSADGLVAASAGGTDGLRTASAGGPDRALAVLRAAVPGPLVAVLPSAAAAPPTVIADVQPALAARLAVAGVPAGELRVLLLGWAAPTAGPTRWHSPAEVSRAALECLDDPSTRVLGVVRPWADRPGGRRAAAADQPDRPDPSRRVDDGSARPGLELVISRRVREYRRIAGLSVADAARRVGVSKAMLSKIENAQTSCSLATLSRLAAGLGVPVTALFRGIDDEREAVFTAAGHGARISRHGARIGHDYELLGHLRGPAKDQEALLVTLTESSEVFPLFQHPGVEFLHMLSGAMVYGHGDARHTMRPGDSLQFDGQGPHGPVELVELPARFLSVTAHEVTAP